MFSFGKVVSSFADDQRYSASVDFDASRGSPLALNKAHGRVPVSDFDLGTHPRAGSTRSARGVGAGSRVRRLAMVWRFVGSPAGRSHEGGGGGGFQ
ncbi:hypothetical protein ACOMHN_045513 [Nucella lapillus]